MESFVFGRLETITFSVDWVGTELHLSSHDHEVEASDGDDFGEERCEAAERHGVCQLRDELQVVREFQLKDGQKGRQYNSRLNEHSAQEDDPHPVIGSLVNSTDSWPRITEDQDALIVQQKHWPKNADDRTNFDHWAQAACLIRNFNLELNIERTRIFAILRSYRITKVDFPRQITLLELNRMSQPCTYPSILTEPYSSFSTVDKQLVLQLEATGCYEVLIYFLSIFDINTEEIGVVDGLPVEVFVWNLGLQDFHESLVFLGSVVVDEVAADLGFFHEVLASIATLLGWLLACSQT